MKKISKYFLMASVFLMTNMHMVLAAKGAAKNTNAACDLIKSLMPVIKTLQTLAFIGAAFVLMDWAWGFIKAGEVKKDDLQTKGIGMLVGFTLLFGIAMLLRFVSSAGGQTYLGCDVFAALGGAK